ncbi:S-adenosylmethionine-dependent methyltransferase [Rhizina undulata]
MPLLPTPDTSHVDFENIYEPSEDSYLLLDTLSSDSETLYLRSRFSRPSSSSADNATERLPPVPLILEVGTGSGIVLSFLATNAEFIFGRRDIVTLGVDVNFLANKATTQTVLRGIKEKEPIGTGLYLDSVTADITSCLRPNSVDVLIFNPPYVPTPDIPELPGPDAASGRAGFERSSHLLSLTYAGGPLGMATTDRLLDDLERVLVKERGMAYLLLCAQNKPAEVAERLRSGGYGKEGVRWNVEKVGSIGKRGGWEVLGIWRIWR